MVRICFPALPDAPLDDRVYAQLSADLGDALLGFAIAHHRGLRDHLQLADLRQGEDQLLGDPAGEVGVLGIGADVGERKDGDPALAIGGDSLLSLRRGVPGRTGEAQPVDLDRNVDVLQLLGAKAGHRKVDLVPDLRVDLL